MPEAYPFQLSTVLRASKSRSQPAAFSMAEPRRGFGYSQPTGTDTPVFWDVTFRFARPQAVVFALWFRETLQRGVLEFTMPIRTEFGLLTHTCRFLPDSLLDTSEDAEVFTYRAQIMARAQLVPTEYLDAMPMIMALEDWGAWAAVLDEAMSETLPEA